MQTKIENKPPQILLIASMPGYPAVVSPLSVWFLDYCPGLNSCFNEIESFIPSAEGFQPADHS